MEAKLLHQGRSPIGCLKLRPRIHKQGCCSSSSIVAVLARPAPENIAAAITEKLLLKPVETKTDHQVQAAPRTTSTVYNDNWFELTAINYLSQSFQSATGLKSRKSGYESLVEAASMVSRKFNINRQQELVIHTLNSAIPKIILNVIKTLLPQSQFTREYFAAFTTVFFAWLIGPSEVKESELNGRREKNVVHVKKCRFLEQSNCVGMCINLCKMPSQAFIKDSLGMPVNMVPNFDDMSCEMIFGQDPPASNDDPALKQPCYKLCRAKQRHTVKCSS